MINADYIKPRQFLENADCIVIERVRDVIERHNDVKVNIVFNGEFVTGDKRANKSNMRNSELFQISNLHEWYERHVIKPTLATLKEFQERDNRWALSQILDLTVNVNRYNPMRVGCYVKLSRDITTKKAVINVQLTDNACFAWSVTALYPAERNSERELSYPHCMTVLNINDIEFPMTLKNIGKIERLNNVSINIYNIEEQKVLLILTDKKEKHVTLLYVQEILEMTTCIISRRSKIYLGSWARNCKQTQEQKYFCNR